MIYTVENTSTRRGEVYIFDNRSDAEEMCLALAQEHLYNCSYGSAMDVQSVHFLGRGLSLIEVGGPTTVAELTWDYSFRIPLKSVRIFNVKEVEPNSIMTTKGYNLADMTPVLPTPSELEDARGLD